MKPKKKVKKKVIKRKVKKKVKLKYLPLPKALDYTQAEYLDEVLENVGLVGYGCLTYVGEIEGKIMAIASKAGSSRVDH